MLKRRYKELVRFVLSCACTALEFSADSYLLKLQRLQNNVLRTIGNLPRRTPTHDLQMTFKIPYLYDFDTKLCRQQAIVILNHENMNVRNIGQGEARHREFKGLKFGGSQADDR
jgi:hypothetical protein